MKIDKVTIKEEKIDSREAAVLLNELSKALKNITGSSGNASFKCEDMLQKKSKFVIARDETGTAIGCGAIRPFNDNTAELKRVYAKIKSKGVGKKIVYYLEKAAKDMGYKSICLETRLINKRSVKFYNSMGYNIIKNYGKYAENREAICFAKEL